jgi:predicted RNA-binding Zn ribbon-like protein
VSDPTEQTRVADDHEFPILGEPLTVELANTLYTHASGIIDFLASTELTTAWFARAPGAAILSPPARITTRDAHAIRQVRDAVHRVLDAVVSRRGEVDAQDVAILNERARAAACHWRLDWPDAGGPSATTAYTGPRADVFLAQLAGEVIAFLGGPQLAQVRRCAHPDCEMFFVQHHHKRRFCHETCAHRARQARYYLATRSTDAAGAER